MIKHNIKVSTDNGFEILLILNKLEFQILLNKSIKKNLYLLLLLIQYNLTAFKCCAAYNDNSLFYCLIFS